MLSNIPAGGLLDHVLRCKTFSFIMALYQFEIKLSTPKLNLSHSFDYFTLKMYADYTSAANIIDLCTTHSIYELMAVLIFL
jgi:hypothetical protein